MKTSDQIQKCWKTLFADAAKTLAKRRKEMEVPDDLPYQPVDDDMILYRVPPPKEKERTEGGLVIPLGYTDPKTGEFIAADGRELAPRPLALLIACGASALDWCMSHGILPGDMVCFGEWEGRERDFDDGKSDTYQRELKKFLMMKVAAIRGSVDLIERMGGKKPQMRLVPHFTDDGVVHLVEPVAENIL